MPFLSASQYTAQARQVACSSTGPIGPVGPVGPTGAPSNVTGPTGIQGATGPVGPTGTPGTIVNPIQFGPRYALAWNGSSCAVLPDTQNGQISVNSVVPTGSLSIFSGITGVTLPPYTGFTCFDGSNTVKMFNNNTNMPALYAISGITTTSNYSVGQSIP